MYIFFLSLNQTKQGRKLKANEQIIYIWSASEVWKKTSEFTQAEERLKTKQEY